MEFLVKSGAPARRLGVLPGSFHPVTNAHLALAEAALGEVDEVLLVMPRQFPHKAYEGVGLHERIGLVRRAVEGRPEFSVAITEGGLFIDIARECHAQYGDACDLWFLCGRDAAERIVGWDYGMAGFAGQLREYGLLVADRAGRYEAPAEYRERVRSLVLRGDWDALSATEVRARIREGREWAHLVPAGLDEEVRRIYSAGAA
jgi:nicotinate (nicotinamide) nucleotide adenylyltransferase